MRGDCFSILSHRGRWQAEGLTEWVLPPRTPSIGCADTSPDGGASEDRS